HPVRLLAADRRPLLQELRRRAQGRRRGRQQEDLRPAQLPQGCRGRHGRARRRGCRAPEVGRQEALTRWRVCPAAHVPPSPRSVRRTPATGPRALRSPFGGRLAHSPSSGTVGGVMSKRLVAIVLVGCLLLMGVASSLAVLL